MSFNVINASEIAVGEPTKNGTMTKIKDNFNDHESRIINLEGSGSTVYPPIIMRVNGLYNSEWVLDNLLKTTANFNLTITGVRLLIDKAGTAGTTEVSLKWKRGAGSWTAVCTTNPSALYSAGDDYLSTNAVLNPSNVNLQAGDILRMDLVSAQTNGRNFLIRIDYNKN